MNREDFDYLWLNCIKPVQTMLYESICSKIINAEKLYCFQAKSSEDTVDDLYNTYEKIRIRTRRLFFDCGENDENKMDSHKISACITAALIEKPIFSFDLNGTPDERILMVNYEMAFHGGMSVLYALALSEAIENKSDFFDSLLMQEGFRYPQTNLGHDEYVLGRVKTLALNDAVGLEFDVLTYADMLFWIELYNIECLKNKKDIRS